MNKKELAKSMEETTGCPFINQTQLAKYLKRSRTVIPEMLSGLDFLETKREKRYFIPDVAGRLMEQRKLG